MRKRSMAYVGAAMLAGALGGALLGPAPVGAVAREIVELQQSVNQLIQGQQDHADRDDPERGGGKDARWSSPWTPSTS